jgi:hypothetical protein
VNYEPHVLFQEAFDKLIEFQLRAQPFQSEESRARYQEHERDRKLKMELAVGEAMLEWRDLYQRTNDVGKAVLDEHEPEEGYSTAVCAHCVEFNDYEDIQNVEWPCVTFLAVKNTG